ncbi:MAG: hypothetical protein Q9213_004586 [Squamulea squamosa]
MQIFLDESFQSIQAVLNESPDVQTLDGDVDAYLKKDKAFRYGELLSRCIVLVSAESNQNTSLAVLVEATGSILSGRYNRTKDIVFGIIRSGRTAPVDRIDEVMGPTLISVPLRLFPARDARVADYLSDVERSTSEASHWEQYRLDNIKNLSKSAAEACDFQSMVIIQHRPQNLGEGSNEGLYLGDYEQHGAWSTNVLPRNVNR